MTGLSQFGRLSKIAALVLVLPHLNADSEGFLHGWTKQNQNQEQLGTRWNSVIHHDRPQYFQWEQPTPVLKASKPTNTYNKQH